MPASKMRRRMGRDPTHLRHSAALLWALMLGIAGAASGGAGSGSSTLPRDAECAGKGACCGSTPQDDTGSGGPRFSVVTVEVGEECQVFRVYMVTYTTDLANKGFCVMAASAAARGFRLNVLGEGRQENFEREMYLDKLWALAEFVDAVDRANAGPDRDRSTRSLILFVDAYDVLVTGSPSRLVKRMLETQKKIMYSSEAGCTASREALMYKLFNVPGCDLRWPAPANDTAMPWINSGVLAGFVPQVAALLEAAREERYSFVDRITREIGPIQEIHAMPPANPGPWDPYIVGGDQSLIGHLYSHHTFPPTHQHAGQLLREALHMGIDYNARLFLSAFGMHIGQEIKFSAKKRVGFDGGQARCGSRRDNPVLFESCRRYIFSNPKATFPVAVHFNGRGAEKEKLYDVAGRMAWPRVPQAALWAETILSQVSNRSSEGEAATLSGALTALPLNHVCGALLPELACGESVGDCLSRHARGR